GEPKLSALQSADARAVLDAPGNRSCGSVGRADRSNEGGKRAASQRALRDNLAHVDRFLSGEKFIATIASAYEGHVRSTLSGDDRDRHRCGASARLPRACNT